ncbi:murein biosynthesis integral membrane protein MurJ [Thermoflexus sp.]|uniref:murein biosynthesis integral membrane protein MurJ n=1 Tax=Thermoflexus sp. TaxID=1969742 RepID=UPI0025D98669|nr:murein biosynthesis integral membrane protein MurJ [Thermoflexus sp.]MDW8181499.1 murein biosynthesis integral membrane protein MurJ [Anaerolineae bacterium]MCS6962646.1 murein biosynthesis integral membrane protein MurJ [Thermoflexus sp.]MCS7352040.1 murein biosynthesis integral membrane protein MurJ [Thermoflexus sp.]MCX7690789.1 murein biosynthesis integral membrane protein MurJ [Thermoflexus sp.]MDW8185223.1 murein biosynthesis integral membrane protein MurJ [Anaerolineae bacterium]
MSPLRLIVRAATLLTAAYLVNGLLGLLRQILIYGAFGTSPELDAYWAAFRIPDLLFTLFAGGALVSAFLPVFTTHRARGDEAAAWRLASAVLTTVAFVVSGFSLLASLAAPMLVKLLLAPQVPLPQQQLTASLMRIMLITPAVFGLSGIIMGILQAHQRFLWTALAPILYNLGMIAGVLFLAPRGGVHGLAWGVVLGAFLHLLIQAPGWWQVRGRYRPRLGWRDPDVREVIALMIPRMLGLAAIQLNFLVNTRLVSGLGAGYLAALNLAWQLMLQPQIVLAQAMATAAFPTLSALAAREERGALRRTLGETLGILLGITFPIAAGMILLRRPLIAALFQRGAFGAASTEWTAQALQFYALGLPAHAGVELLARTFYALHDTRTPVGVGVGAMALNIALSLAWIGPLGHGGVALANTVATTLEGILLLVLLARRLEGLEAHRWGRAVGQAGAATLAMSLALGPMVPWVTDRGWPGLLLAILLGAGLYGLALQCLGVPWIRWAIRRAFS